MRTPFRGSVEEQSEAKTQLLLPLKLSLLPMTKLLVPVTLLQFPTITLLYWIRQLRTFWSCSVTLTTFWQTERKTAPCHSSWHVTTGERALNPENPYSLENGKNWEISENIFPKPIVFLGWQSKFFSNVILRSVIAALAWPNKAGSMLRPAKKFSVLTVIITITITMKVFILMFSIRNQLLIVEQNFDQSKFIQILTFEQLPNILWQKCKKMEWILKMQKQA